jgi:hypothetical protein
MNYIGLMEKSPQRRAPSAAPTKPRRHAASPALQSRHDGVNRHKVTMLDHLLGIKATQVDQEINMVMRVPDTPRAQFASQKQKNIHATPTRYATLAPILH